MKCFDDADIRNIKHFVIKELLFCASEQRKLCIHTAEIALNKEKVYPKTEY